MSSVDYKHLRESSKLLGFKKHSVQKTFYGHLFSDFPLSFQLDSVSLKAVESDLLVVKNLPRGEIHVTAPHMSQRVIEVEKSEKAEKLEKVEKEDEAEIVNNVRAKNNVKNEEKPHIEDTQPHEKSHSLKELDACLADHGLNDVQRQMGLG